MSFPRIRRIRADRMRQELACAAASEGAALNRRGSASRTWSGVSWQGSEGNGPLSDLFIAAGPSVDAAKMAGRLLKSRRHA